MADTIKPVAPVLTAALSQRAVLQWRGASDNVGIAKYEAWDGSTFLATLAPTSRQYTTPALAPGTHALRIVAYDAAGNYANSQPVTITVPSAAAPAPAPPAPTPEPLPPAPSPTGRTLIFEDTFSGTAIDETKWSIYTTAGDHAAEPGVRARSAWTIENGILVCTARNQADGQIVTGGMSMRLDQRGGRWEVRARTDADVTGTMSGVVLLWPKGSQRRSDGEIDFYETLNRVSRRPLFSNVHYGAAAGDLEVGHSYDVDASQWQVMAVDWEPGVALRFYLNGVLLWTVTDPAKMPIGEDHMAIQFDAFDRRTLERPLRMEVDYARVWK